MAAMTLDPYATLGVPRGADAKRLRDAYRRLSRQHHPDRSDDPRATERMQRINRAWEILSDPTRRARYDAETDLAGSRTAAGHWAAARTRRAQWAPPPSTWSTQAAAARAYAPPPVTFDDEDRPSWRTIAAVLFAVAVVGPVLLVALPGPFSGLFFLFVVGSLARGVR